MFLKGSEGPICSILHGPTSCAMSPPSRDPSSVKRRVLDPALKAAYTTDRRVTTIPAARVVPEAAVIF